MLGSDDVFHYTNSGALKDILVGKHKSSLRATGIRYLNDQSELHHGIERVLSVLENRRTDLHLSDDIVDDLLATFEKTTLDEMGFKYFVACFSRATDLVDQWRGYGENGLGFALGYSVQNIKNKYAINHNVTFAACLYGIDVQEETLIREVNAFLKLYDDFFSCGSTDTDCKSRRGWAVHALRTHLLRFKHSAYSQEREWRIILNPIPEQEYFTSFMLRLPIEFRSSRRGLVPYVTLEMPAPTTLKIGPSEYQIENHAAAKMLLMSKEIDPDIDINVVVEDIPYRG